LSICIFSKWERGRGGLLSYIALISERNKTDKIHLLAVIGQKSAILSDLEKE
jgi:hypothetical protein